jgi:hypothetical protein
MLEVEATGIDEEEVEEEYEKCYARLRSRQRHHNGITLSRKLENKLLDGLSTHYKSPQQPLSLFQCAVSSAVP